MPDHAAQTLDIAAITNLPVNPRDSVTPPDKAISSDTPIMQPRESVLATAEPGQTMHAGDSSDPLGQIPEGANAYLPLRVLGRGGMGEVWEALQLSLGRRVALKRMHASADAAKTARRKADFHQEATIAASLEHPNIVPVHDLGVGPDGLPQISMKLVRGRSWDGMISDDFERLSPEELLARHVPILIAMANAVAFAHTKGVVHRDLKPAQVVVGDFGEVVLMDWGLALSVGTVDDTPAAEQAVDPRVSRETLRLMLRTPTTATNPAGTPALMAPEQTLPTAARIGPWTDVFLLGSTLYFLLTGNYPYDSRSSAEAMRLASECRPPAPRKRAPQRFVPEELEELCLHAMDPDPLLRLDSAKLFVEALERYLTGSGKRKMAESMLASVEASIRRNATRSYEDFNELLQTISRVRELSPRNVRAAELQQLLTNEYALLAIAGGDLRLARMMALNMKPGDAQKTILREVERLDADQFRKAAQRRFTFVTTVVLLFVVVLGSLTFVANLNRQKWLAIQEGSEARSSRAAAESLVRFMLTEVRDDLAPSDPALKSLNRLAVRAAEHYTTMLERASRLSPAERRVAVEGLTDVARLLVDQGNVTEAAPVIERLVGLTRGMSKADPGDTALSLDLAAALVLEGRLQTQQQQPREALGRFEEAGRILAGIGGSRDLAVRVAELDGEVALNLAVAYRQLGETPWSIDVLADATDRLDKVLAREVGSRRLGQMRGEILINHGISLERTGAMAESMAKYQEARDYFRSVLLHNPGDDRARALLASSLLNLGDREKGFGRAADAIGTLTESVELFESMHQRFPAVAEYASKAAVGLQLIGDAFIDLGDPAQALPRYLQAVEVTRRGTQADPDNITAMTELAWAKLRLGRGYSLLGRADEAESTLREADSIAKVALQRPDAPISVARFRGIVLGRLASAIAPCGRYDKANAIYRDAVALQRQASEADPDNAFWRFDYGQLLSEYGRTQLVAGDVDAALTTLVDARRVLAPITSPSRKVLSNHVAVDVLQSLSAGYEALSQQDAARWAIEEAARVAELGAEARSTGEALCLLTTARARFVAFDARVAPSEANSGTLERLIRDHQLCAGGGKSPEGLARQAEFERALGEALLGVGRLEEAHAEFASAIDLRQRAGNFITASGEAATVAQAITWECIARVEDRRGNAESARAARELALELVRDHALAVASERDLTLLIRLAEAVGNKELADFAESVLANTTCQASWSNRAESAPGVALR